MTARYTVRRVTDDPDAAEAGITHLIWDGVRRRPYGWYPSYDDAYQACLVLNNGGAE
jgi:hypothetical protein